MPVLYSFATRTVALIGLLLAGGCVHSAGEQATASSSRSAVDVRSASVTLQDRDRWLDSVSHLLDDAVYRENVALASEARGITERLMTARPDDGLILHYRGFALVRQAMISWGDGKTDVPALLRAADSSLQKSATLTPLAESYALMARINGYLSSFYPRRGAELGAATRVARAEAERLDANNPRVWLLRGQAAAYTPVVHGGGPEVTEQALLRALVLFERDTTRAPLPRWGKAEAHSTLGEHYLRSGRHSDAQIQFERALAIAPHYALVRDSLLPAARSSRR